MDISYIPMARGFVYLAAVIDWHSRKVLAVCEGIGSYINFYNLRRPQSSHQARTPDVVHFASLPRPSAEAA